MLFDIWSINSEGKLGNAIALVLEGGRNGKCNREKTEPGVPAI
jgi:hypothetical protein